MCLQSELPPTPVTSRAGSRRLSVVLFWLFCIPHHQKDAHTRRTEVFDFFCCLFVCIAFLRNLGILGPAVEATFKNSLLPAFSLAVEGEGGGLGKINCMLSVLKELEMLFQSKC